MLLALLLAAAALMTTYNPPPVARPVINMTVVMPVSSATEPVPTLIPPKLVQPVSGGTLVLPLEQEPDTLDEARVQPGANTLPLRFLGASLLARSPEGNLVPYLAATWGISPDGLTWTFTLRQDIHFPDGSPLTSGDFRYTFERILDPATRSPSAPDLQAVERIETPDDSTLRLVLKQPYFPLALTLAQPDTFHPLSRNWVEHSGGNYGHNPMSVGPYTLKEWVRGDRIVLERNPDYNWAPAYAHPGPAYIQTILFRIIPEGDAILAGLEGGGLDAAQIDSQQVDRMSEMGLNILQSYQQGSGPVLAFNVSRPPFDNQQLRIAVNQAVDRQEIINLLLDGRGTPQYGPLSRSVSGYWPEVETHGHAFNMDRARTMASQAGYLLGPDGFLLKDGQRLRVDLWATSASDRLAAMLKEQLGDLGLDLNLRFVEANTLRDKVRKGDYQLAILEYQAAEADILYRTFHSSQIGEGNFSFVNDPALDEILLKTRTTVDPTERQQWVQKAQQEITEKALIAPIYTPQRFTAANPRLRGLAVAPAGGRLVWDDAYLVEKP